MITIVIDGKDCTVEEGLPLLKVLRPMAKTFHPCVTIQL